ncbi:DUF4190 domain-containing protein [Brevibacterium aurantiacum]|uniref:DUF4190 domain-containing protein n=1 Tax=Brevibacterium aurantiacum TaxID=273384 RepID=A0A2H1K5U3_BREAU|nr:DUF4190 domain-containing protein [Brevibacterium aurantiacum]GEB24550.1 hypothetical protein BAU01nite_32830 [Brevibacterium aurantiacum]SMX94934.1 protein of unknown function (DUF4190) [Brevibacterium aurantiacum]
MYTRQLPARSNNAASGHSAYGTHPGYSAYPNSAAYGSNVGFGPNPGFAGPVTYIYQPIAPTNTVAIVAMVLSLAGAMTSFVPAGIAGIVMGHIARKQIRKRGERGDALALTALWAGYLGAGFWLIFWGLYIGVMVLAIMMGVAAEEATY